MTQKAIAWMDTRGRCVLSFLSHDSESSDASVPRRTNAIQFDSIRSIDRAIQFDSIQFDSIQFNSIRLIDYMIRYDTIDRLNE